MYNVTIKIKKGASRRRRYERERIGEEARREPYAYLQYGEETRQTADGRRNRKPQPQDGATAEVQEYRR